MKIRVSLVDSISKNENVILGKTNKRESFHTFELLGITFNKDNYMETWIIRQV